MLLLEGTFGAMGECISALGRTIKWMAMESSIGQMKEDILDNTKMTKKKELALIIGLLGLDLQKFIVDNGKMANKTD